MWRSITILEIFNLVIIISFLSFHVSAEETYALTADPIDVVIPCHKKDAEVLEYCIEGIKHNCPDVRRIIVISQEHFTDSAEWFDESLFPFTKNTIAHEMVKSKRGGDLYLKMKERRVSWIYQQLLKLHAAFVIPDISSNVLILDADTIFVNPTPFLNENNGAYFTITYPEVPSSCDPEYYRHMNHLIPDLKRIDSSLNPVCHHMLFQKAVLEDLFQSVETTHQQPFWITFCRYVDILHKAVASEYIIYFNFAMTRTNQMEMRELKWENRGDLYQLDDYQSEGYHFISYHHKYR